MIKHLETKNAPKSSIQNPVMAISVVPRFILILLCALCLVTMGCASATLNKSSRFDTAGKKKIAILQTPSKIPEKFWTIVVAGNAVKHYQISVASYLETEMLGLDKYIVIERGELESVLKEHSLTLSGLIEKGDYKTIGKLSGLDAIVVVKDGMDDSSWIFLMIFGGSSATAKMIDVNSGEIAWSAEGSVFYVSVIPFVPIGLNTPHSIAKAMVRELLSRD